jgi:prepilin-type N-terminal cleavage/methylation domain-containing protein
MFKVFKKIKKDQRGISLMEMVVAVAVFSVVIMMAMDLYFIAQKAQRKTTAIQKVQSDARYSLEAMAREIRVDKIDYKYYVDKEIDLTSDLSTLALRDNKDESIIFAKSSDPDVCGSDVDCLAVLINNNEPWYSLTPNNIEVKNLKFYISPSSDPFAEDLTINEQPRVTIVFNSQNVANRPEDERSLIIQTTVSSRFYGK